MEAQVVITRQANDTLNGVRREGRVFITGHGVGGNQEAMRFFADPIRAAWLAYYAGWWR